MSIKTNITLFFIIVFLNATFAEKHALIIAIGNYPVSGGWTSISSHNDVPHVKAALANLGFLPANIQTLTDEKANKKGIIAAIQALTKKLKKGDIVYIHYSGHGQQVVDDNGDEIDQLDESIVPYDSPMKFQPGVYEGENLIRDDLLGELTDKMRIICGKDGQIVLILDSCHSGTGVRGMGKVRGTDRIMGPDNFIPTIVSTERSMNIGKEENSSFAPLACFFGASAKELNYETLDDQSKPVGSLTLAITTVLGKMHQTYTFEELFERIKFKMKTSAPRQNPQWEGPRDIKILGGTLQNTEFSFTVSNIKDPSTITADIGTFFNVYTGSTVELISKNKNKVICRGEVTKAYLTESVITLESPIEEAEDDLYQIKVIQKAQPSIQISLKIDLGPESHWSKLAGKLSESPMLNIVSENADIFLTEENSVYSLQLLTKEGSELYSAAYDGTELDKIYQECEQNIRVFLQGKFLKSYDNEISKFDFSLALVSVDCQSQQPNIINPTDEINVKVGSCVKFKITNNGITGGYFSLLDIQPDNIINLIIPAVKIGYTAEEYYLKPGDAFTTDYIVEIGEPLGEETLKLIVSKTPQDLSGIIMTQGKSKRGIGTLDPFEQLLNASYNPVSMRGAKVRQSEGDEIGTSTLFFKIVK